MRLFVAIDVLQEIGAYLVQIQQQLLQTINLTFSFHLTLCFLGDRNTETVIKKLSEVVFTPFKLTLDTTGGFPNLSMARVYFAGLKHSAQLLSLNKSVSDVLDIKSDFHPHITLGRCAQPQEMKKIVLEHLSFNVNKFMLYNSILKHNGPEYSVIKEFPASRN